MEKTFYYFPYKKNIPYILYTSSNLFKSSKFKSLYNKTFGINTWKLVLRRNPLISCIFEIFNKKMVYVPDKDVQIIYRGYDSSLYFCLDENLNTTKLYRKSQVDFVEEEFLGSTLNIYSYPELKSKIPELTQFFRDRWEKIKQGKLTIHGDLTPFNICIDHHKISPIDPKKHYSDSIIFDRLYFYVYSMDKVKKRKFLNQKEKDAIANLLDNLVVESFPEDDYKLVMQLAESLNLLKEPPIKDFDLYRMRFISLFKKQNH